MDFAKRELDPFTSRQHLLHHTYSPLISLQSTINADLLLQSALDQNDKDIDNVVNDDGHVDDVKGDVDDVDVNDDDGSRTDVKSSGSKNVLTSALQIFRPFGNNVRYSIPNQQFKITNNQLITKTYASFPVRFEPTLLELLSISTAQQMQASTSQAAHTSDVSSATAASSSDRLSNSGSLPPIQQMTSSPQLQQLFSISSLEKYLRHLANKDQTGVDEIKATILENNDAGADDLYLTFFDKIITSNRITPFETFNHPISHLFVINYEKDSIDDLRLSIVKFRNYNFPKYFQIDDLLMHVFVVYNPGEVKINDVMTMQSEIKKKLNINSTLLPVAENKSNEYVEISTVENCTIEEDIQRLSFRDPSTNLNISKPLDSAIRGSIYEFINKYLIPHMQTKIRAWDDQFLQPKKSIAGRFFSASRKLFNNNSDSNLLSSVSSSSGSASHSIPSTPASFNFAENFYYKSTPEQSIRKLADWSLILRDFKYAYSTYDLVKKDYSNDRAWIYVASAQEMCIVSLLLAQTQQMPNPSLRPQPPDKNTLRKIRHDIIEPFMDNLCYTFKSRFNLKTYCFKSQLMVIELLLAMSQMYNLAWWWQDLIEKYLLQLLGDFSQHLSAVNALQWLLLLLLLLLLPLNYSLIKAVLSERIGYTNASFYKVSEIMGTKAPLDIEGKTLEEQGMYVNKQKLLPIQSTAGLTRLRKAALWYLISIREWKLANNKSKNYYNLLEAVENIYRDNCSDYKDDLMWFNRKDTLFSIFKE